MFLVMAVVVTLVQHLTLLQASMFFDEEHEGGLATCLALVGVFPASHEGLVGL